MAGGIVNQARGTPDRERGYALLMVLVAVGLVAILLAQMEAGARGAAKIAGGLHDRAEAQAVADGAVWQALWQVIPGRDGSWPADTRIHPLTIGGQKVEVSIEDLADRVNINRDSAAAVAVLLAADGVSGADAAAIGAKIVDWRSLNPAKENLGAKLPEYRAAGLPYGPPNEDYQNLAELELVLGMTPKIARSLAHRVTIYSYGQPRLAAARDRVELDALKTALETQPSPPLNAPSVFFYEITSRAKSGAATAFRDAVFRVDMNAANQGKFWRLLDWN